MCLKKQESDWRWRCVHDDHAWDQHADWHCWLMHETPLLNCLWGEEYFFLTSLSGMKSNNITCSLDLNPHIYHVLTSPMFYFFSLKWLLSNICHLSLKLNTLYRINNIVILVCFCPILCLINAKESFKGLVKQERHTRTVEPQISLLLKRFIIYHFFTKENLEQMSLWNSRELRVEWLLTGQTLIWIHQLKILIPISLFLFMSSLYSNQFLLYDILPKIFGFNKFN